jgi:hypothetical protein
MRMNRTMQRAARDERGNVIVVVAVIMILMMLSAGVVARTIAGLHSTRQGQDFNGALANADSGLSDALFRIDQLGNAPASTFCVGPNAACTVSSVSGAPGLQYTARRVDDNTYTVMAKGMVNGQPHAIQATVGRSFLYPFAIFAKTSISFNGNSGDYVPSDGTGPVETVDATGNPVLSPPPDVASNGQITCHGADSPAHHQDYFKGGGTSCDNGYLLPGSYNPLSPTLTCPAPVNTPTTPCLPASHNPCPAVNGVLPAVLTPGVYYCSQADLPSRTIGFPSTTTIGAGLANNGVVEIYIIPTDNSDITFSIADATVNLNGDPTKLRVYLAAGNVDPGNGAHSGDFTGILWAPDADEVNASCKANWRGALVVNTFTCDGGPHLQVHYDSRIQTITQSTWTVTNYTEIPSSRVSLP